MDLPLHELLRDDESKEEFYEEGAQNEKKSKNGC